MQTAVSLVALVLSALSIGWQAATFVLSGGRVKVELRVGALHPSGSGMIHSHPANVASAWAEEQAQQGFTQRVIIVQTRHKGRIAVAVEACSFVLMKEQPQASGGLLRAGPRRRDLVTLRPLNDGLIGPQIPHRMEPGSESQTWAMDAEELLRSVAATKETFSVSRVLVVGLISLGDGRTFRTPGVLML